MWNSEHMALTLAGYRATLAGNRTTFKHLEDNKHEESAIKGMFKPKNGTILNDELILKRTTNTTDTLSLNRALQMGKQLSLSVKIIGAINKSPDDSTYRVSVNTVEIIKVDLPYYLTRYSEFYDKEHLGANDDNGVSTVNEILEKMKQEMNDYDTMNDIDIKVDENFSERVSNVRLTFDSSNTLFVAHGLDDYKIVTRNVLVQAVNTEPAKTEPAKRSWVFR